MKRILTVLTIIMIPYLVILSLLLDIPKVFQIGSSCAVVSLAGLWCIYLICVKMRVHKLRAVGASLLILLVINWSINAVISFYVPQPGNNEATQMVTAVGVICLSGAFLMIDYLKISKN